MVNAMFYGLVTSAVMFGYTLVLYALGYHGEKYDQILIPGLLSYIIFIGGLVLGIRAAKTEVLEESDKFTYGGGVKAGSLISVFMGIGGTVFNYIYNAFINPGMVDVVMNDQYNKLIEKGLPPEQVDAYMASFRMGSGPIPQLITVFLITAIIGVLITLIIAIFTRARRESATVSVE